MTLPGDFDAPDGTTVWAYCWPLSAAGGESVDLHVSSPKAEVTVEVARVGAEREVVWTATASADHLPLPADADTHGCDWPAVLTIPTDAAWRSGYYEVVVQPVEGGGSEHNRAFFVVRPPADRKAPILLALGTNTWNAYNDIGGGNTYTGNTQASFKRPIVRGLLHKPEGDGRRVAVIGDPDPTMTDHVMYILTNLVSQWSGSAGWPNYEQPFLAWAEAAGFEIDVVLNNDLARPGALDGHRLLLSIGHDEYWTWEMRDAVETFIEGGGNVAFLSGNTAYWQVRMDDDGATMLAYKQRFEQDPVLGTDQEHLLTSIWSDHLIGRPENTMTGVTFTRGGYHRIGMKAPRGAGAYTVQRPEHWLLEGTGLEFGDQLGTEGTAVGYECDGCAVQIGADGRLEPTGEDGTPPGFEIVAVAPAAPFDRRTSIRPPADGEPSEAEFNVWRVYGSVDAPEGPVLSHGRAVLGAHTRGGTVVTTGCTEWPAALAAGDALVEQVTRTILDRLG
jgi:hypothetical protein